MDYMRKVIYLKKRENDALMQGQGFARLEKRENKLLIHISMHDILLQGENPVYIVCWQEEGYHAFLIGAAGRADNWDYRGLAGELPDGLVPDKICGILIGKREQYLSGLCQEFQGALLYENVEFEAEPQVHEEEEILQRDTAEMPERAEPAGPEQEGPNQPEKEEPIQPERIGQNEPEKEEKGKDRVQDGSEAMAESVPPSGEEWKRDCFLKNLTEMYPFEDDEIEWCLQMRPEDFNEFPMEYWHYAKNSFLLQGFYNYRHLLYAHTKGKNYVGVPGQYIRKEQYLAARFGFHLFKQTRKKKLSMGDYGYWLREL